MCATHALVKTMLGYSLSAAPGRYGRYMLLVEELVELARDHDRPWIARDVDLALSGSADRT
jgi:hypothetical protein